MCGHIPLCSRIGGQSIVSPTVLPLLTIKVYGQVMSTTGSFDENATLLLPCVLDVGLRRSVYRVKSGVDAGNPV